MEFEAILKEISKEKSKKEIGVEDLLSCFTEKKPSSELEVLKEAAKKLLNDFDTLNTRYRDLKEENSKLKEKLEECDKARKHYYNEATSLRKRELSYTKAFSAIHGAMELLENEIDA